MTPKVVGIGVGLVLGIVWMWLGFWAALLTGGLALVGWFVGSLIEGTINPVDLWNALQGRRGGLTRKGVLIALIQPVIHASIWVKSHELSC